MTSSSTASAAEMTRPVVSSMAFPANMMTTPMMHHRISATVAAVEYSRAAMLVGLKSGGEEASGAFWDIQMARFHYAENKHRPNPGHLLQYTGLLSKRCTDLA